MKSLKMDGLYQLDGDAIDSEVVRTSPGNYALGKKNGEGIFWFHMSAGLIRMLMHVLSHGSVK